MAIEFSNEIRLGDLLTVVSFVGVGFTAFFNIKGRLDVQDVERKHLTEKIEELAKIISSDEMKKEVKELRDDYNKVSGKLNWLLFKAGINPDGEYKHGMKADG